MFGVQRLRGDRRIVRSNYPVEGTTENLGPVYSAGMNPALDDSRESSRKPLHERAGEANGAWRKVHGWRNGSAAGGKRHRLFGALAGMEKRLGEEDFGRREAGLRAVLQNFPLPVVVYALPPGRHLTLVNRAFTDTFGYTAEDLGTVLGWASRAYPDATYRAEVMAQWSATVRRAMQGAGVVEDHEFRVTAKDGAVHEMLLCGTVVDRWLVVVLREAMAKKRCHAQQEFREDSVEKTALDLTENIPVGTYTMVQPPEGGMAGFSFLSRRFLELTGVTREEALEDPLKVFACVHPEDHAEWVRKNAETFEHKRPFKEECRLVVQGETRWITAESTPRVRPDGSTVWEGVLIDVTAQKQAEQQLRKSREQLAKTKEHYRLLAENAADVVLQCDIANRIQWITRSVTSLTGWLPAQLIGFAFKDFVHPDDRDDLAAADSHVLTGTPGQTKLRFRTSQGGYRWINVSLRPLFDQGGQVTGCVAGWRDAQKEVQRQEAIDLERARLKTVLDSLLDPHLVLEAVRDPDGSVADFILAEANPAACEYMARVAGAAGGKPGGTGVSPVAKPAGGARGPNHWVHRHPADGFGS